MLMGTAEDRVIKPIEGKTIFIEDLNPAERARILKEKTGVSLSYRKLFNEVWTMIGSITLWFG